eukprot:1963339-Pleurochrysis_carterae.AAC.1
MLLHVERVAFAVVSLLKDTHSHVRASFWDGVLYCRSSNRFEGHGLGVLLWNQIHLSENARWISRSWLGNEASMCITPLIANLRISRKPRLVAREPGAWRVRRHLNLAYKGDPGSQLFYFELCASSWLVVGYALPRLVVLCAWGVWCTNHLLLTEIAAAGGWMTAIMHGKCMN